MKFKEGKASRLMALLLSVMMVVAYMPAYIIAYAEGEVTYSITFKDGHTDKQIGETVSKVEGSSLETSEYPEPADHTSEGKEFDKWVTDPSDAALDNITQNITITATYKDLEQFDYVFKEAARFGGGEIKSGKVYKGGSIEKPDNPSHESDGYNFAGWDKTNAQLANVTGDITITATYTEKAKYAVKFIDGYKNEAIKSEEVYEGSSVSYPEAPDHTADGYRFTEWTGATDTEMSNVTKALEITANYEKIPRYDITFSNDKSVGSEFTVPAADKTKIDVEGEFVIPDSPKSTDRDNITGSDKEYKDSGDDTTWYFVGWRLGDKVYASGETVTGISGNVEFVAEWKQTLHVKFDVSGITDDGKEEIIVCVDDVSSETEEVDVTLPDAVAAQEGWTFTGWSAKENASTAEYKAGKTKIKVKDAKKGTLYPVLSDVTPASLSFAPQKVSDTDKRILKREIKIIAQDKGSGLKSLEYQIVKEGEEKSESGWTSVSLTSGTTEEVSQTVTVAFGSTLYARAQDVAGNDYTEDSALIKELTDPVVKITDPAADSDKYAQSYTVTFEATDKPEDADKEDASGIKTVKVYADDVEVASVEYDEDGNQTSSSGSITYERSSGNGSVTIDGLTGKKKVRIEALDFCANSSDNNSASDKSRELWFDNTAPTIESISMSGGVDADSTYYYKADNCGLTVKAKDSESVKRLFVKAKYEDDAEVMLYDESSLSGTDEKTAEITADNMITTLGSELEGKVAITVGVEDEAGNVAEYDASKASGLAADAGSGTSSFVLDTVAPELESVVTDPSSTISYTDDDKTNYYYNKSTVKTVYTIKDGYLDGDATKLSVNGEKTSDTASDNMLTHAWGADGTYTNIELSAADKAGNLLGKGGTYEQEDLYTLTASSGMAEFKYGKVIDTKAPEVTVKYSFSEMGTDAKPYQYDEDGEPVLYVKAAVKAEVEIKDGEKLDLEKIDVKCLADDAAKMASALSGTPSADEKQFTFTDETLTAEKPDGTYKLVLDAESITDRAGNKAKITENKMEGQERMSEGTDTWTTAAKAKTQAVFVYDTTSPTYTSNMTVLRDAQYDSEGKLKKAKETADGTTAYHNKAASATFTVSDANINTDLFGANVSGPEGDQDHYSDEDPGWKAPVYEKDKNNLDGERSTKATKAVYKVNTGKDEQGESEQGAFRFTLGGTDKAGNPLVKGSDSSADGADSYNVTEEDSSNEGFRSMIKVIDTVNPEFAFSAKDKEVFYKWSVDQNGDEDLSVYKPFRKTTKATANINTSDKSPVELRYEVVWIAENDNVSTVDDQKWGSRDANIKVTKDYKNDSKSGTVDIYDGGKNLEFRFRNIRVTDRAGNVTGPLRTNTAYLDTRPQKDEVPPTIKVEPVTETQFKKDVTGLSRDFYTTGVKFRITAEDPNEYKSSSGLEKITYKVTAGDGSAVVKQTGGVSDGVLLDRDIEKDTEGVKKKADNALQYEFDSKTAGIVVNVPRGEKYNSTNESNKLMITVTSTDHAGNKSVNRYSFGIDSHGPRINVTWNTPLSGVRGGKLAKYYNFNRYATIKLTEQNFIRKAIHIDTEVTPAGWSDPKGSGRDSVRTNKCSYTADGDYSLKVSGKDRFGNKAELISYPNADNHLDFTIDKTDPVIKVTFDNNSVRNGKYYKANRTATLAVTEHNFSRDDVKVNGKARTLRNGNLGFPATGAFSSGDLHRASIPFTSEGKFNFDVNFTDLAGNKARVVKVDEFIIDKTAPVIRIEGVDDNGIYGGTVSPRAVFEDDTFNNGESEFIFHGTAIFNRDDLITRRNVGEYGGTYSMDDFPRIRDNDDWYTATATSTDMAGNSTTVTKTFSVNRFGSSYDYNNDSATINLVDRKAGRYYTNASQALVLREANVNPLVSYEASLDRGGSSIKLKEGTDFTVSKSENDRGNMYIYKFSPDLFTDEGAYNIVVNSLDAAGNSNTNAAVRSEGKSRSVPVKFVYDVTQPDITFLDIDASEARIDELKNDKKLTKHGIRVFRLGINPSDLISPIVYVKYTLEGASEEYYDDQEKNITKLSEVTGEDGRILIDVPVNSSGHPQKMELVIRDAAGNEYVSEVPYSLTVTNGPLQFMLRYWYWFLAGLAAVGGGAFAVSRSRRNREEAAA